MPPSPVTVVTTIVSLLLVISVFRASMRSHAYIARRRAEADERRWGNIPRRDWELMTRARQLGIRLDIPADTVTVHGQQTGRFTGALMRVETAAQVDLRVATTRAARQGGNELYATIEGDGFRLAARVPGSFGSFAHQLAALFNTRSGAFVPTAVVAVSPADQR